VNDVALAPAPRDLAEDLFDALPGRGFGERPVAIEAEQGGEVLLGAGVVDGLAGVRFAEEAGLTGTGRVLADEAGALFGCLVGGVALLGEAIVCVEGAEGAGGEVEGGGILGCLVAVAAGRRRRRCFRRASIATVRGRA